MDSPDRIIITIDQQTECIWESDAQSHADSGNVSVSVGTDLKDKVGTNKTNLSLSAKFRQLLRWLCVADEDQDSRDAFLQSAEYEVARPSITTKASVGHSLPDISEETTAPVLDISRRNSDATYLVGRLPDNSSPDLVNGSRAYDPAYLESLPPPYVVDLPAPSRVDEDTGRSPQLRGYRLVQFVTPRRPQPSPPAIPQIAATNHHHASDRVYIAIETLPWGIHAFMAPYEYNAPIIEGRELLFRGELRGNWVVKEFTWERGEFAFLRVDEEQQSLRTTVVFPRACIHMGNPDPEVNRRANWYADQSLLRYKLRECNQSAVREQNEEDIREPPPPPPPTPVEQHMELEGQDEVSGAFLG
ncbi:hypothetical protein K438DRAFT_2141356 [Mycena galopus ATCC 62051]|nr:hypothetical protein K438DRAFT_2141356 [Mycena galopus ATCC 62051]